MLTTKAIVPKGTPTGMLTTNAIVPKGTPTGMSTTKAIVPRRHSYRDVDNQCNRA